jgi:tRNA threonylcarbamoyladenosine biosynthesis protein TsaE
MTNSFLRDTIMNMKTLIKNEKELESVAKDLTLKLSQKKLSHAGVLALYGELGAGKTTFTKELAQYLNITENISSPTFVILKSFDIPENSEIHFKKMIHIDTYRLDLPEELERLGFKDLLNDPENLIVIEWPEIAETLLPQDRINIKFNFVDNTSRELEISE